MSDTYKGWSISPPDVCPFWTATGPNCETMTESHRIIRHSGQFEPCLSALTVAIGDVERLPPLAPDQLDRLRQAVIRLSNAERKASK